MMRKKEPEVKDSYMRKILRIEKNLEKHDYKPITIAKLRKEIEGK